MYIPAEITTAIFNNLNFFSGGYGGTRSCLALKFFISYLLRPPDTRLSKIFLKQLPNFFTVFTVVSHCF